ncbi:MAG: hypothetical protein UT84_C0008G0003 [Candidatus Curtissbacteria bacterium GW2011_GWA1_40_16]|uniref:Uncharacterized protein n=1 Tax=Candidatus Curtissbacteria bacterium GW2011_GWA1_40_16 TaxID=1618405 RepID=A0A0G0RDC0_9BACT|nr:MAG: hypothetical protein UT84_C0008G0003 [Candidatus Curtissbacteria bacterium GW2011_GWA1_40_16]
MGRKDADPRRGQAGSPAITEVAGVQGKNRKDLRRIARYAAMGQSPQSLNGGMDNMFGQAAKPENEGQPNI